MRERILGVYRQRFTLIMRQLLSGLVSSPRP